MKATKFLAKIASLTLSLCIALCAIACSSNSGDNNNSQTTPPSTEQGGGSQQGGESENSDTQRSPLLQGVLNTNYYNNLVNQVISGNIALLDGACYDPHPYSFLESKGHDVEGVKSGTLECTTYAFTLEEEPNNLYMATYVETKTATPYYTEYMLKYTLTDKEMQEYDWFHSENYIQSVFMNDVLSSYKTPTIISEVRCTVEAHDGLYTALKKLKASSTLLNDNTLYNVMLKDYNTSTNKFNVYLFSGTNTKMKSSKQISLFKLYDGTSSIIINQDNAFARPYTYGEFRYNTHLITRDKYKNITMYNSQNYDLNNFYNNNLI